VRKIKKALGIWRKDLRIAKIAKLIVWKTKGEMFITILTPNRLTELLENINVNDKDSIEELRDDAKVVDLELSLRQTLLVQVFRTSRISTTVCRGLI